MPFTERIGISAPVKASGMSSRNGPRPGVGALIDEQTDTAVFDEQLAAAPAGSHEATVAGHDRDSDERAASAADEVRDQSALGAESQAERGVLDIAAREDPPVRCQSRRSDRQVRVGGVSLVGHPLRLCAQRFPVDVDDASPLWGNSAEHYTRPPMADPVGAPLRIGEHVEAALSAGLGVVALETTLIAHGLPAPDNLAIARQLEDLVRAEGATPATVGVIGGVPILGLSPMEIEQIATKGPAVAKLSSRDLGPAVAGGIDGATTVAGTITLAASAGIEVMATGGLGGVHRGAKESFDESADLFALHEVPVLVVASGVKSILDVGATLERLETLEVPVIGYRSNLFPGFYLSVTEHRLAWSVGTIEEAAAVFAAHRGLARGGMLLANPLSEQDQLDPAAHDAALAEALVAVESGEVKGKDVTPYLLAHLASATAGASVAVNRVIVRQNATLAARIAVELAARRAGR